MADVEHLWCVFKINNQPEHHLFSASNSPNLTTGDPEREQLAF